MLEHAEAFLDWIAVRPGLALWLLFAAAMLDAIFLIGAFVPASIFLFGAGALVALGSLDLWPTAAVASAGVLVGDGFSFWLGRHYGERLFRSRLLLRYPDFVAQGRSFFDRHGGKGVWLARFLGPVRAVTPAMAGAAGMPTWQFLLIDATAAYLWALVYILPGVLFGASMGLAAEVAARLAGLLVTGFAFAGLGVWLVPILGAAMRRRARSWLGPILDWSRRHRHLGRFGAALADPDQPETPALAIVALTLCVLGGLGLFGLAYVGEHPYPSPLDAFCYQSLHDLQTPWGNALAYATAQLGSPWVYGPTALAVLGVLLLRRKQRAAAHWVAALAFGALISLGLHAVPTQLAPANYFHGMGTSALPRDLVMVIVIYGFIPVLFGTHRPGHVRRRANVVSTLLLALILLGRLYLGIEWLSLTLLSMLVSVLWIGALTLGYRRHRPDRLFARSFLLPVILVFLAGAGVRWYTDKPLPERPFRTAHIHVITDKDWAGGSYAQLPLKRVDLRGRSGDTFDLQWAGQLPPIRDALLAQGWQPTALLSGGNLLRLLTTTSTIDLLPVLPQVHAGRHPELVLRRPVDDTHQALIRLWSSGWQLQGGDPVWLGSLSAQSARTYYKLFRYPVTDQKRPVDFPVPPPFAQRRVQTAAGPLWLIAASTKLYTAEPVAGASGDSPSQTPPTTATPGP